MAKKVKKIVAQKKVEKPAEKIVPAPTQQTGCVEAPATTKK